MIRCPLTPGEAVVAEPLDVDMNCTEIDIDAVILRIECVTAGVRDLYRQRGCQSGSVAAVTGQRNSVECLYPEPPGCPHAITLPGMADERTATGRYPRAPQARLERARYQGSGTSVAVSRNRGPIVSQGRRRTVDTREAGWSTARPGAIRGSSPAPP
jgi:hypothetical protein